MKIRSKTRRQRQKFKVFDLVNKQEPGGESPSLSADRKRNNIHDYLVRNYRRKKGKITCIDWKSINKNKLRDIHLKIEKAREEKDSSALISAQFELESTFGNEKWKKEDHLDELVWIRYRNFCFVILGRSLPSLNQAGPVSEDLVAFLSFKQSSIEAFINGKSETVECRGLGPVTLLKTRKALTRAAFKAGHDDPFQGKALDCYNELMEQTRTAQIVKRAKYFHLWSDFDCIRTYCLEIDGSLLGVYSWTLFIVMFSLFLRRSDIYSLRIENIGLPTDKAGNGIIDEDGYPRYLNVFLPSGKVDDRKGTLFRLLRNYRDRNLCPVVALCNYLAFLDNDTGPVFPYPHKITQGIRPRRVSDILDTLFSKVFQNQEHGFTSHSLRRTSAKWAALTGASSAEIKRAGRWKSDAYLLYVGEGRHQSLDLLVSGQDSIGERWMFFPIR